MVDVLHALGARVVVVPLITTVPLVAPADLITVAYELSAEAEPRWVVFTSATAVRLVAGALGGDRLTPFHIAAVGRATASALAHEGIAVELVPSREHSAVTLADSLLNMNAKPATVWLPSAAGAADELPGRLATAGALVRVTHVYRSDMPHRAAERVVSALDAGVDAITLTSGSTARHLAAALGGRAIPPATVVACIGPETAAAASAAGLPVAVIAAEQTAQSLVDALVERFDTAQPLR